MDLIAWDPSSPQLPWELDYAKRIVPTSWAEEAPPQGATLLLPSLTVLIGSWGVIGNSIILWLLGFQVKRGPFAVYILNMTTANLLFLFCHILNIVGKLLFSLDLNIIFLILTEFCGSVSENFLVAMSMELNLSVLCPVWYHCDRPKHASAIVSSVIWVLTALCSCTSYFLCKYPSSSNGCKEFLQSSHMWLLLLFLLDVLSLTLLFCSQCSRCQCSRCQCSRCQYSRCRHSRYHHLQSSSLGIPAVLIILQLLLHHLPFIIGHFSSEFNVTTLGNEDNFNLSHSESDAAIFETEDDIDVLLSCLETSIDPFTCFFMSCCKKRRPRESCRALLQRTLLEEEELEYGTEMVSGSPGLVSLTLRTQDRTSEEPRRCGAAP